ncbi:hypothetical protein Tco_1262457 [Tanacetum coccineum]
MLNRNKYQDLRDNHDPKNHLNDDTPMCERHEANYIQSEGISGSIDYVARLFVNVVEGNRVKKKRLNVLNIEVVTDGVAPSIMGDSGNAAMEVELPYVVEETMEKEKLSHVVNTSDLGSYPPLPMQETTLDGKRVAYPVVANYVRNTWGKYGLVRSMFSSSTWLFSFQFSSMEGLNAMLENGPWSSYARAMIELRADVELKDNIVAAMPKINREGYYTCKIRVGYEWKPPRCAIVRYLAMFKRNVPRIQTTANTSANKKKNVDPPKEVTNPFEVLTSVENDEDTSTKIGIGHTKNV